MRLEHMHLAAERSKFRDGRMVTWDGPWWHLRLAFDCNLSLNESHEKWDKAIKYHALVAVTYLSRYHPVFRQMDARVVMRVIYRFASMPSDPDTGPKPTVEQLWAWMLPEDRNERRKSVLDFYDRVFLPGVQFFYY